jgi:pyruvate dehydrogenase E2 component (dihydrolipoamide acetyltransferase)
MTEGNLVRWLKKEGEMVKAGQILAEIETDKATMELEAVDEGILAKILVPEGTESVAVKTPIALLLEEDEDPSALEDMLGGMMKQSISSPPPEAPHPESPSQMIQAPEAQPLQAIVPSSQPTRIFATPLARRIADQQGINLSSLSGSGPHGRIIKSDVDHALAAGPVFEEKVPSEARSQPLVYGESGYADIPLTNMRKVIAKRLTESKQQVPHFYLTVDCELDALLQLRSQINDRLDEGKLSVNDFIVRATALALMKVPAANASWQDTHIRHYQAADVCVAVAIESGLVTPIVRSAHLKSLTTLSTEIKSLADRARAGKLKPEEFQGGGFTISNLGMYGIRDFAAIINPPQACILAIGAGEKRPIVKKDTLQIATLMTCTLSADHRVVDGATGANFLAAFKALIEDPLRLVI